MAPTLRQTFIWTALPNGVRDGALHLSVFVAPRLEIDDPGVTKLALGQFKDLLDWPATKQQGATGIQFTVQFGHGQPVSAIRQGDPPRSDLWKALFNESTFVRPYAFEKLDDPTILIHSYPVRSVLGFVKAQHLKVAATAATELPSMLSLANEGAFGKIGSGAPVGAAGSSKMEAKQAGALAAQLAAHGIPTAAAVAIKEATLTDELDKTLLQFRAIPAGPPDPPRDFLQVRRFHGGRNTKGFPKIAPPEVDFHQMLAMLNNYPKLLRLLGLVHDLVIPSWPAGVPNGAKPALTTVQVTATWTSMQPKVSTFITRNTPPEGSCRTRCLVGATTFAAAPRQASPELSQGYLRLGDKAQYEVGQIDVDGAARKSLSLAGTVLQKAPLLLKQLNKQAKPAAPDDEVDERPDTQTRRGLPALRSAGIWVARVGRSFDLASRFTRSSAHNQHLANKEEIVLDAEDLVRGYYVEVHDSKSGKWRSLCKRHGKYYFTGPKLTIEADDEGAVVSAVTKAADGSSPDLFVHETLFRWAGWSLVAPRPGNTIHPTGTVERIQNLDRTEFHLETTFTATPGSLPRLRYGVTYYVRARAADLAGNSVPFDANSTDFSLAAGPITYSRFEPIASPAVVRRHPRTEGESLERLVIRSNYDTPASETTPAERHIAPPKIAQLMAEEHGMFDSPAGLNKQAYALIIARESGAFAPESTSPDQVYFDVDKLPLPYLPDPLARGAAWRDLPGAGAGSVFKLSDFSPANGKGWPDAQTFRLVVEEGAGPPQWDPDQRVLRVKLPKGNVGRVRLSSYPGQADLAAMGQWRWQQSESALSKQIDELRNHGTSGSQWLLTPSRELVLVHAVRQPLLAPMFFKLAAARKLGETSAALTDTMTVDRKSTIRVDVLAEWTEPIDPLDEPTWKTVAGKAQPFQAHVAAPSDKLSFNAVKIEGRHEFGDTKYRQVSYSAVATTRFSEYFRRRRRIVLTSADGVQLTTKGIVPGSEVVKAPDGSVTYARDRDYWMTYERATIFLKAGGSITSGSTLYVSFLEPPITRQTNTPTTVHVPSSARPATPKVLYAIPAFGWKTQSSNEKIVSERSGGWLRIYLERPWWSSGAGELLGVVIYPGLLKRGTGASVPKIPNELKPYVTQWGMDPIWASGPTYETPVLSDFKAATETATGLSLDEVANVKVGVAGHQVAYDEGRRLWYCDVQIDAGPSYFPFVRLALARFQPKSIEHAHLSRIVLTDFAQLAPDRTATVAFDPKKPTQVTVSVAGRSYSASQASDAPRPVTVTVQTRRPDVPGELGWVSAPDATYMLNVVPNVGLPPGVALRSKTIPLPAPRGSKPMRLLIQEYERLLSDGPFLGLPMTRERLVYADVLDLGT